MNRLDSLPRGFGSFPVLEVLDLSYNSLNDESMPGNFWIIHSLRALYLRYTTRNNELSNRIRNVIDILEIFTLYEYTHTIQSQPSKKSLLGLTCENKLWVTKTCQSWVV